MGLLKIQTDFDRLALLDDSGWNHNNHYSSFLLRLLPAHCTESLEIGCGAGGFARQLAPYSDHVLGVDLSPQMIRVAQARSTQFTNIAFQVGDVMALPLPAAHFDCIASIATLHHMPLEAVLTKIKGWLKPGGVLLVLDLYAAEAQRAPDLLRSAVALPASTALRWLKTGRLRPPPAMRAAWDEHGSTDRYVRVSAVRQLCRSLMPGAIVRKHLFWRYSLVWRKPPAPILNTD